MKIRQTVKLARNAVLRGLFEGGQRIHLDILPRHFYSEIPNIRELRRTTHWRAPLPMTGVAGAAWETQLEFVRACCTPAIVGAIRADDPHPRACRANGERGYGPAEAAFLFAYVCSRRPGRVFQIGCGVSTAVCLFAAEHAGYSPEIVCVEPYPTDFLQRAAAEGRITLVREKAQHLRKEMIDELPADTLFFVDSSHTLGPAGEVTRIILEMLPRLKPGAAVHFHDITFPYDYQRKILRGSLFFWHESVLLHAFLAYNSRFRILASLSMLHYACPDALRECLPPYRPAPDDQGLAAGEGHFPSSTYLEVVA